jgi:hypothetical protein
MEDNDERRYLFKLDCLRVSSIFVSNTFLAQWRAVAPHDTGITFNEVWSD